MVMIVDCSNEGPKNAGAMLIIIEEHPLVSDRRGYNLVLPCYGQYERSMVEEDRKSMVLDQCDIFW